MRILFDVVVFYMCPIGKVALSIDSFFHIPPEQIALLKVLADTLPLICDFILQTSVLQLYENPEGNVMYEAFLTEQVIQGSHMVSSIRCPA